MTVTSESVLTAALLERCRERAPIFDRENRFFQEDFAELRAAGYLNIALPKEFGGRKGPDPTRYGDWEINGIACDF